jgi:hypothetical protein
MPIHLGAILLYDIRYRFDLSCVNIFISSIISGHSTAKIEELLLEDQNVKRRRERYQKQSSLLSKLTRQLSIHDNRAAAASNWSNGGAGAFFI